MSKRIAITNLNASTIDILNTIRANASMDYQSQVPAIATEDDIPRVGEILYGYPARANQFLSALINRIALVKIKSALFNNAYAKFKKGYLEYGETVEEVFVNIAKAREFSAEKAESREFKRTIPDVRAAFHMMNWRVQYPITVQQEDLRMAFRNASGVQDLIAKIIESVYGGAEYDEFLLFKYLIIKAVAHGKMMPVSTGSTMQDAAVAFRGTSNMLTFMGTKYNSAGVHTVTDKKDQYIFMDATYNAQYDVNVLASAFNMDKADFMGRLVLIDDFTSFDNERFDVIRANSDMIESVTSAELALMQNVKAVLVDAEWFQVYDNAMVMTEQQVASGMYWNYFLNVWKTVSSSPFSNAVVFVANSVDVTPPATFNAVVEGITTNDDVLIYTLRVENDSTTQLKPSDPIFVQDATATAAGIAVHKYGVYIIPTAISDTGIVPKCEIKGVAYTSDTTLNSDTPLGETLTFSKNA